MVAKSYQNLKQLSEPYKKDGKMYISVEMKSGKAKEVRWYSDAEYAKMYGAPTGNTKTATSSIDSFNQKKVLGFEKGYITIFKGDTYSCLEWFHFHKECRYSTHWGWYVISTEEIPSDIPLEISPVKLEWEPIADKNDETKLTSNSEVIKQYVNSLIYEPTKSKFVGKIGERLDIIATVVKAIELEDEWGHTGSTIHVFKDDEENEYVWTTAAKHLGEGCKFKFRGTVKEHKVYRNSYQTVLTRCSNFEEAKEND